MITTLSRANPAKIVINTAQWQRFCHGYLFDEIRGKTFGQAFCDKFDVNDWHLLYTLRDEEQSKQYILRSGYIKAQVD